jgi:hypothetical protein
MFAHKSNLCNCKLTNCKNLECLHTAKAIVLTCIDFRLVDDIVRKMNELK